MLGIVIIFGVCAIVTGIFIILELNWSINNFMKLWAHFWGPGKILAILGFPICFLPVGIDVGITIGVGMLLGTEGMMGLMVSMMVTSIAAGYLYYMRRKHKWRFI